MVDFEVIGAPTFEISFHPLGRIFFRTWRVQTAEPPTNRTPPTTEMDHDGTRAIAADLESVVGDAQNLLGVLYKPRLSAYALYHPSHLLTPRTLHAS